MAQAQTPAIQVLPAAQGFSQPPQFSLSLWTLTHLPSQVICPAAQAQLPAWQVLPSVHAVAHVPQFIESVIGSTQAPLHSRLPALHAQAPALHSRPPVQALPHIPQFAASLCKFTQVELQAIIPPPQLSPGVRHMPATQLWPFVHCVPHVPQFPESVWALTQTPPHTIDGAEQAAAVAPPAFEAPPLPGPVARPPEGLVPPLLRLPPAPESGLSSPPPTSTEQPLRAAPKTARVEKQTRARVQAIEKRERCPAVGFFMTITRGDSGPDAPASPRQSNFGMVRSFRYRERGTGRTGECLERHPKAHTAAPWPIA
jgi:hypothetical protein